MPPQPIRQLRDLTRARTAITRERSREVQRLEKLLEDAGIKLSAVASDILGVSGRQMLEALIAGDRDPAALADPAKRRLRSKIPELTEALTGRFNEHHAFLARVHLDLIDRHTEAIETLTARIEVMIEPFQGFRDLICTIPGISTLTADIVIAETGADMTRFPTAKHLASWAGTTPGHHESAGKVKSSKTRPGNRYLQGALGAAAMACAQNPSTYYGARYRRIASRRGPQKANVAIQRSMLTAIWHLGTTGTLYDDPGADYFHPTPPREDQEPGHPPARSHGLSRHPGQRLLKRSDAKTHPLRVNLRVSVMAKELDAHVEDFRTRPLDQGPYTFVAADALTMKVREGGRVVNTHVLVATGVNADGHREILGVDICSAESEAGWLTLFRGLNARGLTGVKLVTSDAHSGLVAAMTATLDGAAWQRCRTHYADLRIMPMTSLISLQDWDLVLARSA